MTGQRRSGEKVPERSCLAHGILAFRICRLKGRPDALDDRLLIDECKSRLGRFNENAPAGLAPSRLDDGTGQG